MCEINGLNICSEKPPPVAKETPHKHTTYNKRSNKLNEALSKPYKFSSASTTSTISRYVFQTLT